MDTAVREEGRAHNCQDKSRKRLSECAETLSLDLKPSMVDKDVHRSEGVVGRRGRKGGQMAWPEGVVGRRGRKGGQKAWPEGVVGRRGQKAWSEGVVAGEHSVQRCELVRSLLRIRPGLRSEPVSLCSS